ncbi:MAG: TolC family protein [Bacteroidales bacterium]|nr:TolC family protein [Bacteroidales bacterium]
MKRLRLYITALSVLLIYRYEYAQDSINDLSEYLMMAVKNNPGVHAAFNEYLAALEKVPRAGALTDPQVSLGYYVKPMELPGGNQVANLQVMQMFPWFGTLRASKDEASMMAKSKYEIYNAARADLFFRVTSSWYLLMKYDREIKLVTENIEFLTSLEKLALIKYGSPDASASSSGMNTRRSGLKDVLRVKMEILEYNNKLTLLSEQRLTEQVKFNSLLNRDLHTIVNIGDSLTIRMLPAEEQAVADSILSNHPMLNMLNHEAGSYSFMEEKAKKMGLPMFSLGLNYMLISKREGNSSMMNGKDMLMPMISVSLPIYRNKYKAMQHEARLMKEALNQRVTDLTNNLQVQYRLLIQDLEDAERRIALYKEQEALAKKTADILVSDFTVSGTDYEEVLRMQQKVLDYGFKHLEAVVDYNTSVALAEKLMNSVKY